MKKTFDLLDSKEIAYIFQDYKKEKPSAGFLEKLIKKVGLSTIINKKGTTFRKLDDNQKIDLEKTDTAIPLLIQHSSMLKRPILELENGNFIVGFDEDIMNL